MVSFRNDEILRMSEISRDIYNIERKVAISMARKDSKNYNYTTQEQIIIKKNEDARLPKRLGSDEKIQAASEGSKIE